MGSWRGRKWRAAGGSTSARSGSPAGWSGSPSGKAWKLYSQAFDDLRYLAVQRHVMYGDEFDAVMADALVEKYLVSGMRTARSRR